MEWNPSLTQPGAYSTAPIIFYEYRKVLGISPLAALLLTKINRHDPYFQLQHYKLGINDRDNEKDLSGKEKRKLKNKTCKVLKELEQKRLIVSRRHTRGNNRYQFGETYSFKRLNERLLMLIKNINRRRYKNTPINSRWDDDILQYGYLKIPHILLDHYGKFDITDKELLLLILLLCKGENVRYPDSDPIFNLSRKTIKKHRDSLIDKGIMTANRNSSGWKYSFRTLDKMLFLEHLRRNSGIPQSENTEQPVLLPAIPPDIEIIISERVKAESKVWQTAFNGLLLQFDDYVKRLTKKMEDDYESRLEDLEGKHIDLHRQVQEETFSTPGSKYAEFDEIDDPETRMRIMEYCKETGFPFRRNELETANDPKIQEKLKKIDLYLIEPLIDYAWKRRHENSNIELGDYWFIGFKETGVLGWMVKNEDALIGWCDKYLDELLYQEKEKCIEEAQDMGFQIEFDCKHCKITASHITNPYEHQMTKLRLYSRVHGLEDFVEEAITA